MAASTSSTTTTIMNVWRSNFSEQLDIISSLRRSFPIIAVDTEFPGFRWLTPREAPEEDRYRDLKMNVDSMHLIQLGITMFDEQGRTPSPCASWQFNFSDFNSQTSLYSQESVDFLRRNGMDFERNMRDGIPASWSTALFNQKLFGGESRGLMKWVTFHGLYDVAYIVKLMTGERPLPCELASFLMLARNSLGEFYDIKYIARFCEGLRGGEIGLARMSELMGVAREGPSHQAGHDSLLVGAVFHAMRRKYGIFCDDQSRYSSFYVGVLYGLDRQSQAVREMLLTPPPPPPPPPAQLLPPPTYQAMPGQFLRPQYRPPFHGHLAPQAPRPYYYWNPPPYYPPRPRSWMN